MTSTVDERVDEAEREGGAKQFLNAELKELPRYGLMCDCAFPKKYIQHVEGDTIYSLKFRLMCLNCGGMMFE